MKNTSKLESDLVAAFELYRRDWSASLPQVPTTTQSPKMQKVLRRQSGVYYPLFGTTARRVASVVLAVILGLTLAVVNVESLLPGKARMLVSQVEQNKYEITFTYKGEIPQYAFQKKYPSYLPESYHSVPDTFHSVFQNKNSVEYAGLGGYFVYSQSSLYYENLCGNPIEYTVSTTGRDIQHLFINENRAIISDSTSSTTLIFFDDQYVYYLSGTKAISWSEYTKIAESIQ